MNKMLLSINPLTGDPYGIWPFVIVAVLAIILFVIGWATKKKK